MSTNTSVFVDVRHDFTDEENLAFGRKMSELQEEVNALEEEKKAAKTFNYTTFPSLCEGHLPKGTGNTLSDRARERAYLELHNGPAEKVRAEKMLRNRLWKKL
jgi:hypothetical protein